MSVLFFGVRRVPRYEKDWFSGLWLDGGLLGKAGPAACCWDAA